MEQEARRPGWAKFGAGALVVLMSVGFALQTSELVWNLYPEKSIWMKVIMVFGIDGFCAVWLMSKMFYDFKKKSSTDAVNAMWWVTFSASVVASFVQMSLDAGQRLNYQIDPSVLTFGFFIVTIMFIANLVTLCVIVDSEWRHDKPVTPVTKASPVSLARVTVSQTAELPQLGAPGRKSTDLEHAKKVARYEEEGICPWNNERQWKASLKRKYPDEETMAAARKELGYDK